MSRRVESGLRNYRIEFAREDEFGEIPSDPEFNLYSTVLNSFTWGSESVNDPRRGLGSADPFDFLKGPETHEFAVNYDFVKWFVDGSSNPYDASYDGIMRDQDNLLPNSHLILTRQEVFGNLAAENTVSGNGGYGTRIYSVGHGGLVDEVELAGDTSDAVPVTSELTYIVQKARSYQIDQPDTTTFLAVSSDNANDTMDVTIENEAGDFSETLTLDGTTLVSTSTQTDDVDAFELSEEAEGTVTLYINDGDDTTPTQGDALAEILGKDSYENVEGDLGIPAVQNGSRETSIANAEYQRFVGNRILRATDPYPHEIPSATLTVANNVEEMEVSSGYGMGLHAGNREIEFEATMYGENTSHKMLVEHLTNRKDDITWEMIGGDLTIDQAVLDEPGERAAEEGEAVMTTDNMFTGTGITLT